MDRFYFALLVLYFVLGCEAARILIVVPSPSISHQVVFYPLAKELASRGHEVVTITTDPAFPKGLSPPNLTEIDVHDVSYGVLHDVLTEFRIEDDLYDQMKVSYKLFYKPLEVIVKSEKVEDLLKYRSDHFDLLIVELIARSALIFSHFFKAPVISMSSLGMMLETKFASGAPAHPLLYPNIFHKKIYNLTTYDKIEQLWNHVQHEQLFLYFESVQDDSLKKLFGPNVPTVQELTRNIDMFFLNTYPIWNDNQPVPPNVIYIGGIHQRPHRNLPKDLKSYLDSSKNGVIYMSLGTNIQPSWLGEQNKDILMEVFSKLPYDILLKWDVETIHGCPKNVKVVKWVPQSDLLRHPAVILFITQAGLQSTEEAINAGVPLIALPMMADQFYNAEKYLKQKIGLKLDIYTLTVNELSNAIKTIIEDKSYRDNVIRLRSIMKDQSQTPLERAIWWTEYVLRHGGAKHLRAPTAYMSWVEYYELKLVSIMIFCSMTLIVLIFACLYSIINFLKRKFSPIKQKIKSS